MEMLRMLMPFSIEPSATPLRQGAARRHHGMPGLTFAHRIFTMSWSLRPLLLAFSLLLFAGGPAPQAFADRPETPENTPSEKSPAVQFGGEEVAVGYVLVPVIVRSSSGGY